MATESTNKPAMRIVKNDNAAEPEPHRVLAAASTVCEFCFGTGVEVVPGKGARPCDCRAEEARRRFRESAGIPEKFKRCTFETFRSPSPTQAEALGLARALVADFPHGDRGLLLMGSVGVGKTHLAVAILRGLLIKGVPCRFYESGSLLKRIQDSYNPISQSSEMSVLAPVFEAKVLVLDELGATIPTDWVRDTIYQIINTRYNDRKLTVFTTNFLDEVRLDPEDSGSEVDGVSKPRRSLNRLTVDSPRVRAARTAQTLEERIGTRLRSRLYEMCRKVVMEGADHRKLPKT